MLHLQGRLQQQRIQTVELMSQEQRREASSALIAQHRLDADAQLAFNADLHAFANKFHLEPPQSRSRTGSPLPTARAAGTLSPVRAIAAEALTL